MEYNSGVIVLVISNRPRAARTADLKLLARLLPELYSTQSYYHYLLLLLSSSSVSLDSLVEFFILLPEQGDKTVTDHDKICLQ